MNLLKYSETLAIFVGGMSFGFVLFIIIGVVFMKKIGKLDLPK